VTWDGAGNVSHFLIPSPKAGSLTLEMGFSPGGFLWSLWSCTMKLSHMGSPAGPVLGTEVWWGRCETHLVLVLSLCWELRPREENAARPWPCPVSQAWLPPLEQAADPDPPRPLCACRHRRSLLTFWFFSLVSTWLRLSVSSGS
jgi:hypothetical protein